MDYGDRGVRLIRHNLTGINFPDDPYLPWKMELSLKPTDPVTLATLSLNGKYEEIVVQAKSLEALENFIEINNFDQNSRTIKLVITGPEAGKK